MNKRKHRVEIVRQNDEYNEIRKNELALRKKEHKLTKERFFFERMSVEGHTNDLKREMKGIYKHCIAEVNKEEEDLKERIKIADAKIIELEKQLKE